MKIKLFTDLMAWKKSHELVLYVYKITKDYPKDELFGLISQSKRAASSVAANIVEGFRRQGLKDSLKFYNQADASLEELKYHLILARDLDYISKERYNFIFTKAEEAGRLLYGWIKSQKQYL